MRVLACSHNEEVSIMPYQWNDLSDLPGDRKLRRERSTEIRGMHGDKFFSLANGSDRT